MVVDHRDRRRRCYCCIQAAELLDLDLNRSLARLAEGACPFRCRSILAVVGLACLLLVRSLRLLARRVLHAVALPFRDTGRLDHVVRRSSCRHRLALVVEDCRTGRRAGDDQEDHGVADPCDPCHLGSHCPRRC